MGKKYTGFFCFFCGVWTYPYDEHRLWRHSINFEENDDRTWLSLFPCRQEEVWRRSRMWEAPAEPKTHDSSSRSHLAPLSASSTPGGIMGCYTERAVSSKLRGVWGWNNTVVCDIFITRSKLSGIAHVCRNGHRQRPRQQVDYDWLFSVDLPEQLACRGAVVVHMVSQHAVPKVGIGERGVESWAGVHCAAECDGFRRRHGETSRASHGLLAIITYKDFLVMVSHCHVGKAFSPHHPFICCRWVRHASLAMKVSSHESTLRFSTPTVWSFCHIFRMYNESTCVFVWKKVWGLSI